MRILAYIILSLTLVTTVMGQSLRGVDKEPVSGTAKIRDIYDLFNGYTACENVLSPKCIFLGYPNCSLGVEYSYLEDVVASFAYRECAVGTCFNYYNCRGTCVGVCAALDRDPIDKPKENCPVILDLKGDGIHLSGTNPAVGFDIDADGIKDRIAWTGVAEDDAFLCMDRNHNGIIDDGTELFGYATPLISGQPAKVGYRALSELDRPDLGGNHDGKIDAMDEMFSDLHVWQDRNRDGISQANEIYTLDQVEVVALDFKYKSRHLTDAYGNVFRYESRVDMHTPSGGVVSWPSFDVIFAEQAEQ